MQADANAEALAPGFQPYRATMANGRLVYLIVIDDSIVASDLVSVVGGSWKAWRERVTANGAKIEALPAVPPLKEFPPDA